MDEVKPVACVPTVEHREPCESRGSRTVLGAPGGEIPPGDSTIPAQRATWGLRPVNPELQTLIDRTGCRFRKLYPFGWPAVANQNMIAE